MLVAGVLGIFLWGGFACLGWGCCFALFSFVVITSLYPKTVYQPFKLQLARLSF